MLLVCASYNGEPPENATAFVDKLRGHAVPDGSYAGVKYAVFRLRRHGLGGHLPGRADPAGHRAGTAGRQPDPPRGAGDAQADFDGQYRAWHAGLWSDVAAGLGLSEQEAR